jgi:hypothetical protein
LDVPLRYFAVETEKNDEELARVTDLRSANRIRGTQTTGRQSDDVLYVGACYLWLPGMELKPCPSGAEKYEMASEPIRSMPPFV